MASDLTQPLVREGEEEEGERSTTEPTGYISRQVAEQNVRFKKTMNELEKKMPRVGDVYIKKLCTTCRVLSTLQLICGLGQICIAVTSFSEGNTSNAILPCVSGILIASLSLYSCDFEHDSSVVVTKCSPSSVTFHRLATAKEKLKHLTGPHACFMRHFKPSH